MYPASRKRLTKTLTDCGAFSVGLGLHALIIVALGFHASRQIVDGGAPVINLSIAPSAMFDSDSPPSPARKEAQAGGGSGATTPQPTQVKPRPARILETPLATPLYALPDPIPALQTAPLDFASEIRKGRSPGPEGSASNGDTGPSTPAGTTQGGGARALGAAATSAEDVYAARVLSWIERHKRHPGRERGVVTVSFQLDRDGRVHRLRLVRSSGSRALDRSTLDRIAATQPFPRPDSAVDWRLYPFTVNVDYRGARGG